MSGSLIANSSLTNRSQDSGSNSFANIYGSLLSPETNTSTQFAVPYDPFTNSKEPTGTPNKSEAVTKDAQLQKILSNSELIRLYELKLKGQEKDGGHNVDDLIKTAREKIGVNNGDINKYIGYKRTILESLKETGDSVEKITKALDDLNSLPESLKASLKASLKEKLNGKLQGSIYSAEQILDGNYATILKANPEIAKSISNSLKALSTDDAFTTKLSSIETKIDNEEKFNKNATKVVTAGVVGAGIPIAGALATGGLTAVGALNFWNPIGWGIGAVAVAGLLTNDGVKEGLGNYWNALTG
jgi:hypothetical protein